VTLFPGHYFTLQRFNGHCKEKFFTLHRVALSPGTHNKLLKYCNRYPRADEEMVSVTIRVSNPDYLPVRINGDGDPAQTPPAFC
jgi:hypothetical protein